MRTLVDIPRDNLEALDALGALAHVSRTELIRRAVEEYVQKHVFIDPKAAFGIWKDKPRDAVRYQRKLRREWDRR